MSFYLNSNASPDLSARAPVDGPNYDPALNAGWFDRTGDQAASGVYRGALNLAETTNLALSNIAKPIDWIRGDDAASDAWFANMVDPIERQKDRLDLEARDAGVVAQLAGGLTEFGTEIAPGGVASLAASQTIGRTAKEARRLDLPTAYTLGSIQGAVAGLGAMLPIKLPLVAGAGPAALQRVAYGAFTGGALGVLEPAAEKQVYMAAGLPNEAAKIDPLNARQIVLNAALGGFLGYAAHRFPGSFGGEKAAVPAEAATAPPAPLVDAAMVANGQQHLGAYASAAEAPAAGAQAIATLRQAADDGMPITQMDSSAAVKPAADAAMQQGAQEIGKALGIDGASPRPVFGVPPEALAGFEQAKPTVAKEAQTGEQAAGWEPRDEAGSTLPVSYQELQDVAKRLSDAGIEIPSEEAGQAARSAVDSLAQSVDKMKRSDFYQGVINDAASCILSGGLQ